LLDLWRDFGIELEVCDESEYWEMRSLERLEQKVARYDRMVAAVAGQIIDDAKRGRAEVEGRNLYR